MAEEPKAKPTTKNTTVAASQVLSLINDFRKSTDFCDVKVVVEKTEYPAHKNILAAFSPVFKSMFSNECLETKESVVNLPTFEAAIMDLILKYAYGTTIEITARNALDILHAAHYFQATQLYEDCCNYIEENLNQEHCLYLIGLAEVYDRPLFKEKAMMYALRNFTEICHELEFLELDEKILISIIKDDGLHVENEDIVFDAVRRWYHYKEEERAEPVLLKVLQHVRMGHMDPKILQKHVKDFEAMRSPACTEIINQVLFYQLAPDKGLELQNTDTRERTVWTHDIKVWCIFGKCLLTKTQKILCLSLETPQVVTEILTPSMKIRSCHTSETELYCLPESGHQIYKYDSILKRWHLIADMLTPRCSFGFAEMNGFWYAVGGFRVGTTIETDIVERYDASCNVWSPVSSMPVCLSSPAVVSTDDKLYVMGGQKNSKPFRVALRYDGNTLWTGIIPFPEPIPWPRIHAASEKIFIWSLSGKRPLMFYNCIENRWTQDEYRFNLVSGFITLPTLGQVCIRNTESSGNERVLSSTKLPEYPIVAKFRKFRADSILLPTTIKTGPTQHQKAKRSIVPLNFDQINPLRFKWVEELRLRGQSMLGYHNQSSTCNIQRNALGRRHNYINFI